jgi:ribosomal protein S12
MNAGPGGRVRLVNSKEPLALIAKEQDVLERRMNVIIRGVEELDLEWKAEGHIKKDT